MRNERASKPLVRTQTAEAILDGLLDAAEQVDDPVVSGWLAALANGERATSSARVERRDAFLEADQANGRQPARAS